MYFARQWKTRKTMIGLFVVEFFFTVAVLTLYALAQPNAYRTKLWQDGYDNGFNSSPDMRLYSFANHARSHKTPIVWSQFITDYNVVISVLSMFILLAKSVLFVIHLFIPWLSIFTHIVEIILYAYSLYAQSASDLTDPEHLQRGPPWYITKSCSVVHTKSNYGYCEQAKAVYAVTMCMLVLFVAFLVLAVWSSIPTRSAKLGQLSDLERSDLPAYAAETHSNMQPHWEKDTQGVQLAPLRTPRTVAFQSLEGSPSAKALPFRERYGGS